MQIKLRIINLVVMTISLLTILTYVPFHPTKHIYIAGFLSGWFDIIISIIAFVINMIILLISYFTSLEHTLEI